MTTKSLNLRQFSTNKQCSRTLHIRWYVDYNNDTTETRQKSAKRERKCKHDWPGSYITYILFKLHTRILNDFCAKCNMSPVCRHTNYCIDYTFNNNIKHFPTIDHFLLSEQLYQTSVNKAYVSHDSENFSDHDPVHGLLNLSVARVYKPHSAWLKLD